MKARRPSGTGSPRLERAEIPLRPDSGTLSTEEPKLAGQSFDPPPSREPQAANDSEPPDRRDLTTSAPNREILTVDELADFLRLNRKTVYEAIDRGDIPGVRRIGESYRIHRATVLEWFASSQGRVSHSRRHR
jgi:excisionase family DNA binding protein